jgi:hypothetical protein
VSYTKTPPTGTLLIIYKSVQRNSTESPLLQLHLEIRDQIGPWSLVLAGGLLRRIFEALVIYDSETGEVLITQAEPRWFAKYCALKGLQQPLAALLSSDAPNNDEGLIIDSD